MGRHYTADSTQRNCLQGQRRHRPIANRWQLPEHEAFSKIAARQGPSASLLQGTESASNPQMLNLQQHEDEACLAQPARAVQHDVRPQSTLALAFATQIRNW